MPEECLFDFSAAKYSPVHFFISDEQSEEHDKFKSIMIIYIKLDVYRYLKIGT